MVAPNPLFTLNSTPSYILSKTELAHVLCPVCDEVLQQPIETECGAVVCCRCMCRWLEVNHTHPACPFCYDEGFSDAHVRSPSNVVTNLLNHLLVKCEKQGCIRVVRAELYKSHLQSSCKEYFEGSTHSPSRVTISEILAKESARPVTPNEKKVAENLIKRLIADKPQSIIHVPTRGQVSWKYIT